MELNQNKRTIFIVEDDPDIREIMNYALNSAGYEIVGFDNGETMLSELVMHAPDLLLLDIMLPGMDGLSILKAFRSDPKFLRTPVMLVSAKMTELDKVKGLDIGADDYLTKPFGVMELVSRVKALLRRTRSEETERKTLKYLNIELDENRRVVTIDGIRADLTYKEFELLRYFILNISMVLSRENILNAVWDFDYEGESRTVDMHIKTLRKKLGAVGEHIITIRNCGYKLE
ncbi:MAG: response regulator transcription factor [Clostridia bacterium]